MIRQGFGRRLSAVALAGLVSAFLVACQSNAGKIGEASISIEPYSKVEFNTEQVQQGDIRSSIELELKLDDYTSKNYSVKQSDYKVQEVYVKDGDHVSAGDVMIQFVAEDVEKMIDQYTEQKEKDELSIEHYNRLAELDSGADYSSEIQAAKEDMELADTYITEQNERMKEYQVIAEKDGTVTYVNQNLQYGYCTAETTLITVDSGSSDYVAETSDSYEFEIGTTYDARLDEAVFSMTLTACDKYVSDATGQEVTKLTFTPAEELVGVSEKAKLSMTIEKPVVKNVVYVNKNAVIEGSDGNKYVYTVDENGYRSAVKVTTGDTVDDYTLIQSGLEAGERVVINR